MIFAVRFMPLHHINYVSRILATLRKIVECNTTQFAGLVREFAFGVHSYLLGVKTEDESHFTMQFLETLYFVNEILE